jgi:hypothetical protein
MTFLRPTKASIAGTALLLVASFVGGFLSRVIIPLFMQRDTAGGYAGAGRGAFAGGGPMAGNGAFSGGGAQFGGFGLLSAAVDYVILAILFYVVVSFVIDLAVKEPARGEKGS